MNLSNMAMSLIRTLAAMLVGALLAWLVRQGIPADDTLRGPITEALVFVLSGGYYTLVRWLEGKWPWLGWLLGAPVPPQYPAPLSGNPDAEMADLDQVTD